MRASQLGDRLLEFEIGNHRRRANRPPPAARKGMPLR